MVAGIPKPAPQLASRSRLRQLTLHHSLIWLLKIRCGSDSDKRLEREGADCGPRPPSDSTPGAPVSIE